MSATISIGSQLRAAREKLGMSVIQAAERLHVDSAVVDALESGEFTRLGPPVFVRGHLHRYAELVGEPDTPLQEAYRQSQDSGLEPDLTHAPRRIDHAGPREAALRWPLLLGAALLVLGILIWVGMGARAAS